jgi:hypothetical protein
VELVPYLMMEPNSDIWCLGQDGLADNRKETEGKDVDTNRMPSD